MVTLRVRGVLGGGKAARSKASTDHEHGRAKWGVEAGRSRLTRHGSGDRRVRCKSRGRWALSRCTESTARLKAVKEAAPGEDG